MAAFKGHVHILEEKPSRTILSLRCADEKNAICGEETIVIPAIKLENPKAYGHANRPATREGKKQSHNSPPQLFHVGSILPTEQHLRPARPAATAFFDLRESVQRIAGRCCSVTPYAGAPMRHTASFAAIVRSRCHHSSVTPLLWQP